ncbi:MAG: PAS domain S-box protein [Patescibacteria group bacterium]|nr:PAS domain S-box protein [Patescibacteria group bacterium]
MRIANQKLVRYGFALAAVGAGVLLRYVLTIRVGPGLPTYITFYPVVMVVALTAGVGPGILATLALTLITDWWLIPPAGILKVTDPVDGLGEVLFVSIGMFMTLVASSYRNIRDNLEELVIRRTTDLNESNRHLTRTIEEHERAAGALRKAKDSLEARTVELERANDLLGSSRRAALNIMEDITKARDALRESEERFRFIAETSPVLIYVSSLQSSTILYVNPACAQTLGFTVKELVGRRAPELYVNADDRNALIQNVKEQGYVQNYEVKFMKKDGTQIWISTSVRPVNFSGVPAIIGASIDVTERKRLATMLQNTATEQQAILDAVPAMVFYKDKENRFIRTNKAFEDAVGLSKKQLEGKSLFDLFPHDLADAYWKDDLEVIASSKAKRGIIEKMETLRGTREVQTDKIPYFDGRGNIIGVIGFALDITDQKKAEALHSTVLETAQLGFWYSDVQGKILEANDAYCRMSGYRREELLQMQVKDIEANENPQEIFDHLQFIVKNGHDQYESRHRRKNGSIIDVDLRSTYLDIEGGRVVVFIEDITDRKYAQESLQQSEERLNRSQAIAHLGSWELDVTGNRLMWSDEVYRIFGLKPQEFDATYEAFLRAIHPDDRAAVDTAYSESIREGRDSYEIEHRIVRKATGEIRYVHERCEHVRDASGRIIRSIGSVHDITERKIREEQLRQLNRTLHALSKSNQALMRATDEVAYLNDICKIITTDCGHAMAWIGYAEPDGEKNVRSVASAGFDEGYVQTLRVTWADDERGQGPTGTAVRTGKPAGSSNMQTDPKFKPWRAEALRRGYASSIALPLLDEIKAFGSLTIYSKQTEAFSNENEIYLLGELAADLSFGIRSIRLREVNKLAEEALKESELRYRTLFESAKDGILILDYDTGLIVDVNPFLIALLKYTHEDFLKKHIWDIGVFRDIVASKNAFLELQQKEFIRYENLPLLIGGGEKIEVEFVSNVYLVNNKRVIQCNIRDITERKRAEEALRHSEERFRMIADTIPNLVWTADANGTIDYTNLAFQEYTGVQPSAYVWSFSHPDDRATTDELWKKSVHDGNAYQIENRIKRFDGEYFWHLSKGKPIKDAAGKIVKWYNTATNIHTIRMAQQKLLQADAEKNNFIAIMSHELRNPLTAIMIGSELIRKTFETKSPLGIADRSLDESIRIVEQQTKNMSRLLDDLLDISRLSRGKIQLRKHKANLVDHVKNAVDATRPFIQGQRHQLLVTLPADPIYVHADPVRLEQIVVNLLNNAAKYTSPGGKIWLTVGASNHQAKISVRDTGIGIESDIIRDTFNLPRRFVTPFASTKGELGIGLKLTRDLVTRHGGTIDVRSEGKNKGSEFIVQLPESPEAPAGEPFDVALLPTPAAKKLRILVVEDDVDNAKLIAIILESMGCETQVRHNGPDAIPSVKEFRPQIALVDIGLPGMDGYELAKILRKLEPASGDKLYLVAITGFGQDEDKLLARQAGFDLHLTKPLNMEMLKRVIADFSHH